MKNLRSIIVILLIGVVYAFSMYAYKPYRTLYVQIGGDAFGYYLYLPSFFIHHDLKDLRGTMLAKYQHASPKEIVNGVAPPLGPEAPPAPNGRPVTKFTMGVAVMEAPFFFMAHAAAPLVHQPRDGMSKIYMYAMEAAVMFYVLVGFILLVSILRRYFSDRVVALTILCIGLATNLYFLVSYNSPLSHPFLFFLYSLLIYTTICYYETLKPVFAILIGLCCGLVILVRVNEAYACLIPILWGLCSVDDIKQRLLLIRTHFLHFAGAVLIASACIIPQLLYWKYVSGHFLYYSYGNEKFDFFHPHIIDGMFSFVNGWLAYSPVMFLALAGIYFAVRLGSPSLLPQLIFIPLHIYIIYSWWCWFYLGSYGSRPMTEAYPLLSIPLAFTIDRFGRSWWQRAVMLLLVGFFCWLTLFQAHQISLSVLQTDIENWRSMITSFGKTKLTYDEAVVVDTKEFQPQAPKYIKTLCENDFEDTTIVGSSAKFYRSGLRSVCLSSGKSVSGIQKKISEIDAKPGQWIKASVYCYATAWPFNIWEQSMLVIDCSRKGKEHKWTPLRLQTKINNPGHKLWNVSLNQWGKAYFYSQLPVDMKDDDILNVYLLNDSGPDLYVDDLKVELYDDK